MSDCVDYRFPSREAAEEEAFNIEEELSMAVGWSMVPVYCNDCQGWHLKPTQG